ncbi:MAG: hypothetical protein N3G22_04250 [Candidatus Micrarchaeota archaeon]|nr:hypothetical protein [Candidatus Micrarchaeota archaeon]
MKKREEFKSSLAQGALEFLISMSLMVLLLILVVIIYYQSYNDFMALSIHYDAYSICNQASAQLSALASAGEGTEAIFRRPSSSVSKEYTLKVSAQERKITVSYGNLTDAACGLTFSNITNGTAGTFFIDKDVRMRNLGGGVIIG